MTEIPDDFAFCKHGRFYGLCWEDDDEVFFDKSDDPLDPAYEEKQK